MRYKYIISAIAILTNLFCYSQFKDYNNTIGFECGSSGGGTPIVYSAYRMIEDKNYERLTAMLYSENTAENFLAVVLFEKLDNKGKLKLTEKNRKRISKLYKSTKTVEVCGGCTFLGFVKLSELLANKDKEKTRNDADKWASRIVE